MDVVVVDVVVLVAVDVVLVTGVVVIATAVDLVLNNKLKSEHVTWYVSNGLRIYDY